MNRGGNHACSFLRDKYHNWRCVAIVIAPSKVISEGRVSSKTIQSESWKLCTMPIMRTYRADCYLATVQLHSIITRQSCVQLKPINDDLSCFASLNKVFESKIFFKSIFYFNLKI
jgi:hypothetical protein